MTIRYTRRNPCPVCGGGKDLPQGHGVRCFGYTDATGQYARCTREEHAGGVPLNTDGTTYSHRIRGSCRCGNAHAAALPQNRVRETSWRVYGLDGSYAVHWRKDQPDGSKRMWWAHADGTLSKNGAISGKDRLYGLELVDRQTKGILVEGEKAADALRGVVPAALLVIGVVTGAPTVPAGAVLDRLKAIPEWLVWADADENGKGQRLMDDCGSYLSAACKVGRVVWAEAPDGGDAYDYLQDHKRDDLFALLEAVELVNQPSRRDESPRPVPRQADIVSARELASMDLAEPRYAVHGIVPEGATMVAAKSKLGKSWLVLDFSIAVAAGGRALGQIPVEQGEVLYLALEDTKRRVRERLGHLLREQSYPPELFIATTWPKFDDGGLIKLDAWLRDHPRARLVVIDVWKRVRQTRQRGANLYDEDYEHLVEVKTLADRHHVAILVVHHTRKSAAEDVFDEISGTGGVAGVLDAILILHRARGVADAELWITGRDLEEAHMALRFESGSWTLLGEAADVARSKERRAVLEIVTSSITPITPGVTPAFVASALGKPAQNIRHLMFKMAQDGELQRLPNSKYAPGVMRNRGSNGNRGNAGNGAGPGERYPVTPVSAGDEIDPPRAGQDMTELELRLGVGQ